MWEAIKIGWHKFEEFIDWVLPRVKVKLVSAVGFLLSLGVSAQLFFQSLPTSQKLITAETLALLNTVLFIAVFWLRDINGRVEKRKENEDK